MTKFKKYLKAVKFLESTINLPSKNYELKISDRSFFIERLRYLLKLLGNPHRGFKYIHIAGTAGKGSTVNMIHEILRADKIKVGSFYSPHPTTAIERIKVSDKYIAPDEFAKLVEQIKPVLDQCSLKSPYGTPSYFEIFLAIAFLYFKQKKCKYLILEAGLGGTHDATNIIEKPFITAITNIGFDHQDILGKTLKEIAQDKAGIIKKSSVFLTTETRPEIIKIFQNRCQRVGAKYHHISKSDKDGNNLLAKTVAEILKIDSKTVEKVIEQFKLPCRFELIQKKPKVILDGAHGPAKIKKLVEKLNEIKYQKLILIYGSADNKDYKKALQQILPLADEIILTRYLNPFRKSANLKKMHDYCRSKGKKSTIYLDPWQALKYGQKLQKANDLLLITGSFFLTGELRTNWISENDILAHRNSYKK